MAILWYRASSSLGCNRQKEGEEAPPTEKKKEDTIINLGDWEPYG